MRLFHFSDDPSIIVFQPRPLRVPVDRGADREWLNGPLVWATDEAHALLYLFPRECPRIVIWATDATTDADHAAWFGVSKARAIAYVEDAWVDRIRAATVWRYAMPPDTFDPIHDVGMWVSRQPVVPSDLHPVSDLAAEMDTLQVELRAMPRLAPLKSVWLTTLHASGIRTRNAVGWGPAGWSHSGPGRTVVP